MSASRGDRCVWRVMGCSCSQRMKCSRRGHAVRSTNERTKETTCSVQSCATHSVGACRQGTRGALTPRIGGTRAEGLAHLPELSGVFLEVPAARLGTVGEPAPQRSLVTEVATFYDDRIEQEWSGHNDALVRTTQPGRLDQRVLRIPKKIPQW